MALQFRWDHVCVCVRARLRAKAWAHFKRILTFAQIDKNENDYNLP